jgi:hypothetical protein
MWSRAQRRPPSKAASPYGRGPVPAPHPALVPITSIKDRLRVLSARLLRQRDAVEQGLRDVEEMQKTSTCCMKISSGRRRGCRWPTPPATRTTSSRTRTNQARIAHHRRQICQRDPKLREQRDQGFGFSRVGRNRVPVGPVSVADKGEPSSAA